MNMLSSSARESSRELIYKSLSVLREMQQSGHRFRQSVPQIKIHSSSAMTSSYQDRPDWAIASSHAEIELENTPIFHQFKQAMEQDFRLNTRMNTMIGTSNSKTRMTCRDFYRILLAAVLESCSDDLRISDDGFNEVWDSAIGSLLADTVNTKCWCIIEGVVIPDGSTEILQDVFLRSLSTSEVETLWNNNEMVRYMYPLFGLSRTFIDNVRCLLETTVTERVLVGSSDNTSAVVSLYSSVMPRFDSVVMLMRLLCTAGIGVSPMIQESDNIWRSTSSTGSVLDQLPIASASRNKLTEQDVEEIQKLLKKFDFSNTGTGRAMPVYLRRMGYANGRLLPEDKLLDTMIALEAMVFSDSGDAKDRGELTFRLSMRLAKFLGADSNEQRRIFKELREAYRLRSKIVHGNKLDSKDMESIVPLESIAKTAVRKYLHVLAEEKKVDWDSLLFE